MGQTNRPFDPDVEDLGDAEELKTEVKYLGPKTGWREAFLAGDHGSFEVWCSWEEGVKLWLPLPQPNSMVLCRKLISEAPLEHEAFFLPMFVVRMGNVYPVRIAQPRVKD